MTKISIAWFSICFFYAGTVFATTHSAVVNALETSALEHLQVLSSDDFAGRKFSSTASEKSQSYLQSTLQSLKVAKFKGAYRHTFEQTGFFNDKSGANIIGYIPGTTYPNQFIVLTAHYDHLGTKHTKVFNGADDNASGTAALLHYGKLINNRPLKHSVILLFTDGEEINLLGAKAFINQQEKLLAQIKLNINLDMIAGSSSSTKLRFISRDLSKILTDEKLFELEALQANLKESSNTRLTAGFRNRRGVGSSVNRTNWRMASDHGAFSKAGIPFIYFGVGAHKNYHSEHDTFENINQALFIASVDVIYQQLLFLDSAISPALNTVFPCE